MYYSADQPPPSISRQSSQLFSADSKPIIRQRKRRLYIASLGMLIGIVGGGTWWYSQIQAVMHQRSEHAKATVEIAKQQNAPQVAGVSFGDLLKKQRSYTGWVAGLDAGNIVIMNPQSGEVNTLTSVKSQWFGPISTLEWSPDRSKLAYLILPDAEAHGFDEDPQSQAQKMGLESVPSPQTFPFGKVVILDISTKQVVQTGLEVRNTPKSIVWLDDNRIAAITTNLSIYNVAEQDVLAISGAGVTDANEQLQSPLVWDKKSEVIYFTKVKKNDQVGSRVLVQVSIKNNEAKELTTLRNGTYEEVTVSRSVDMALDSAAERLAFINDGAISYLSLGDRGVHALPPQDDWLWLKDSIISGVEWLSPSKIAFTSMGSDGEKVWAVWNIPDSKIVTFGRGSDYGSWDKASGRLALVRVQDKKVSMLTPNWQDPLKSTLESFDLPWRAVAW